MPAVDIPIKLVPDVRVLIEDTRVSYGLFRERWRVLLLAQKLAGGAAVVNVPVRVPNVAEAARLGGVGSMLHQMARAFQQNVPDMEVWALPMADNGAGVAATGAITFAGPATETRPMALYIGGERVEVAVTSAMTAAQIATAAIAAINAAPWKHVTAVVNGGNPAMVDLTAPHKGEAYNGLDIRHSYYDGEALPSGVTVTVTAMASGAGNPSMATAIASMGADERWKTIVNPWTDTTNMAALEAELADRFGAVRMSECKAVLAITGTLGTLLSYGAARNSRHTIIVENTKALAPAFMRAARVAAMEAASAAQDPAMPTRLLQLTGDLGPRPNERLIASEREQLLAAGISTTQVDVDGVTRIERLFTAYKTTPLGVPDKTWRSAEKLRTIEALRFDLRAYVLTVFPRMKLADDDAQIPAMTKIMTPNVAKAAFLDRHDTVWRALGLVEGEAVVEASRPQDDEDTLDVTARVDLVDQFYSARVSLQRV